MFVYYAFQNQGSGLVIQGYTQAAQTLGHEVVIFGRPNPKIPLNYSLDVGSADAVIFIFEWTTQLRYEDQLDLLRLIARVPRERRLIIDGDGNYNDRILVENDCNHRDALASRRWIDACKSLTDKICQPTLNPLRSDVHPFLFYGYNPKWEVPLDFYSKEFGMIYVGHSKCRWPPMYKVLHSIEPVRAHLGRIALVGFGWDSLPWWATSLQLEDFYFSDPEYLQKLAVEVLAPVHFEDVIKWMSKGLINPVISRPTFDYLGLATPRLFETPAANTIPLFGLSRTTVEAIYGDAGLELLLMDNNAHEKIFDIVTNPEHYRDVVVQVRRHLAEKHSHKVRLEELIRLIQS
jgi:hypothetical protein